MSTTDQYLTSLHGFHEIQVELHQSDIPLPITTGISFSEPPANRVNSLPGGSLRLGLAEDGLPILLDLYDPAPGPLLVAGDGDSGKTAFLQSLALASNYQNPGEVQFGVLTPFPEEWTTLETLPGCLGIWPACHPSAPSFLSHLISWADVLPATRQVVLVLIDALELLAAGGFQLRHDLRWLLVHGPECQIWPVVAVNPGRLNRLESWLDFFQTRILGHVNRPQTARLLVGGLEIDLIALLPGKQLCLSCPDGWLKFWLPPI